MNTLTTHVLAAMLSWSPVKEHAPATPAETEARFTMIASDIVAVTLDPNEQPLFPGDMEKAETGLQLAAMAFKESRYWSFVDDGSCNSFAWKKAHGWPPNFCDGSRAWTIFQIQTRYEVQGRPKDGILLVGGEWEHSPKGYTGRELVADRKAAVRVALHMMRKSLRATGSLCGYTGEPGPCPKAKERRDLAHSYFLAHPYKSESGS